MELMGNSNHNTDETRMENESYLRAKKKVDSLRGFYRHLLVYLLINLFFSGRIFYEHLEENLRLEDIFSDGNVYSLWIIWGFILVIHGFNVFSSINIFGYKWEQRKIKQYMNEETHNRKKSKNIIL